MGVSGRGPKSLCTTSGAPTARDKPPLGLQTLHIKPIEFQQVCCSRSLLKRRLAGFPAPGALLCTTSEALTAQEGLPSSLLSLVKASLRVSDPRTSAPLARHGSENATMVGRRARQYCRGSRARQRGPCQATLRPGIERHMPVGGSGHSLVAFKHARALKFSRF